MGSIKIETILGTTGEEIKKEAGNKNASQTHGSHEKEAEAEQDQHHKKTSRGYRQFQGDSKEEENLIWHERHM